MTITALPPAPTSSDPTNFAAEADTFLGALPTFVTETNTLIEALNFNDTNSTSTTTDTIATGATSITVQASKSYVIGMTVKIASTANGANWMLGEVTSYDTGTGALGVTVRIINGSGTLSDWTVSFAGPFLNVQDTSLILHTGNGLGSTSTAIRRFTTSTQTGSGIATYADSSTLGAVITISEDGVYAIDYMEEANSSASFGISLNSSQLTTAISSTSFNVLERAAIQLTTNNTQPTASCSVVLYLVNGDVVRPHTSGAAGFGSTSGSAKFTIRKVFEYV